ncbi:MAG: ATP-binding protein [Cyclobacteriaceae bacterium]|nr:ATP-binding protein [Cyclobacteriaceae bacterium]
MEIHRPDFIRETESSILNNPITAIMGPRQCGKTTLARAIAQTTESIFFDLEDPSDYDLLSSTPKLILQQQKGLVILDEIQRMPELFPLLRVLADEPDSPRKYLILGSASPDLIQRSSESLAGRVAFIHLTGFNVQELGVENLEKLWQRGGFPKAYLGTDEKQSLSWRENFIQTFLERDIANFGFNIPPVLLRRFWLMLAHYHGQIWNGAEFARAMGTSEPTVKRYLDILTGTFMIRQLYPWHENIKKRQVKASKVYIRDSGILHALLGLEGNLIYTHVKSGASWEGFIIEQLMSKIKSHDFYYWRTHTGTEIDLMVLKAGKRLGFEIKLSETPKISRSMHSALDDLKLDKLFIIYKGRRIINLDEKITAVPAYQIPEFDF